MNNEKPIDSFAQFQKELDTLIKTLEKVLYHPKEYLRDPSEKNINELSEVVENLKSVTYKE